MKIMTFLYFAYGSNLLRQRLLLQNPSAKFVAVGKLEEHVLAFSCLHQPFEQLRWRGGAATVVEKPGSSVWGCVWKLDDEHKATLDRQEGVYFAKDVSVVSNEMPANKYVCRTYQLPKQYLTESTDHRPSPMYMDVIIRGAKQNKLPDEYIGYLETLPTNGRHENIDLYTEIIKQLEENDSQ